VTFGPHETNLGRGRAISDRHVAYYARRSAGGAGLIITEEASVHDSDWPYERAPLASECADGWRAVVEACRPHGTVVLAALGHAGGQGTSHWSQRELWAPGRVPEVNTREIPKEMEERDIEAVIRGFVQGACTAVEAGCDGVEINAGQFSLARQFLSGLTNTRGDQWGADRSSFLAKVIAGVRDAIGPERVLALRLSCDELAPWAGITPEMAPGVAAELVVRQASTDAARSPSAPMVDPHGPLVDMLTVVRGSIYSVGATRPDGHTPEGFNAEMSRAVADAVHEASNGHTVVVAQGSIVDPAMGETLVAGSRIGAVEMTRAQIADAELVGKLRAGQADRIRPCVLCNQLCSVRDNRNPIVSCVVDPFSGHETAEAMPSTPVAISREVLVVGAGPAGMEAARVAAAQGHSVRIEERSEHVGGHLHTTAAQPGRHRFAAFAKWLEGECRTLGVGIRTGVDVDAARAGSASHVIVATGGRRGTPEYAVTSAATVLDAAEVLVAMTGASGIGPASIDLPGGDVLVWDPIGGPTGVAVAELLTGDGTERTVHLATPDYIVGNELARSGDMGPANARLANAGVVLHRRRILRKVRKADVVLSDRFSDTVEEVAAAWVVDCGHRLPDDLLAEQIRTTTGHRVATAGDCVAPRTVAEAVLEGRRRALEIT
jgi:2,4-dienoyl-CoA reductase (NADPH2)